MKMFRQAQVRTQTFWIGMIRVTLRHQVLVLRRGARKATGDTIVDTMLEIVVASKLRATAIMKNEEHFSIRNCIKLKMRCNMLMTTSTFFTSDLFENFNTRETFLSL